MEGYLDSHVIKLGEEGFKVCWRQMAGGDIAWYEFGVIGRFLTRDAIKYLRSDSFLPSNTLVRLQPTAEKGRERLPTATVAKQS